MGRRRRDVTNFSGQEMNETLYSNMTQEELQQLEEEKAEGEEEPVEHVHGIYEVRRFNRLFSKVSCS